MRRMPYRNGGARGSGRSSRTRSPETSMRDSIFQHTSTPSSSASAIWPVSGIRDGANRAARRIGCVRTCAQRTVRRTDWGTKRCSVDRPWSGARGSRGSLPRCRAACDLGSDLSTPSRWLTAVRARRLKTSDVYSRIWTSLPGLGCTSFNPVSLAVRTRTPDRGVA